MPATRTPLILVPGLLCDAGNWPSQIDGLRGLVADIEVPDHGMADSLVTMAQQILAAAPPSFALAGHSMGGRVALEVLRLAPHRVTRLALLDSGYEPLQSGEAGEREKAGRMRLLEMARSQGMRTMAEDWARGMVHPSRVGEGDVWDSIITMISRSTPERFANQINALLNRPDARALLPAIRVPTLVLCGREDNWSNAARHEAMAAMIPGSRLLIVPECGHMSTLEQPEAVNAALRTWLTTP